MNGSELAIKRAQESYKIETKIKLAKHIKQDEVVDEAYDRKLKPTNVYIITKNGNK